MSSDLIRFEGTLSSEGRGYHAIACGRQREDSSWEGWLEFEPVDGGPRIPTDRETTQPDRPHLLYWATGLTATYLDGAFLRATRVPPVVEPAPISVPSMHRPARRTPATTGRRPPIAVMDPFAVHAEGDEVLVDQLGALGSAQLRNIVRAYALSKLMPEQLEVATPAELRALILAAVRERSAGRAV